MINWKYIQKKMKSKFNITISDEYVTTLTIELLYKPNFKEDCLYCGRGDSTKGLSLSLALVPETFKESCWLHDNLYSLIKHNIIDKDIADKIFYCSMLEEAGWNIFKRIMAKVYY